MDGVPGVHACAAEWSTSLWRDRDVVTKHQSYVVEDWVNFVDCYSKPLLRDNLLGARLGQLWRRLRDAIPLLSGQVSSIFTSIAQKCLLQVQRVCPACC